MSFGVGDEVALRGYVRGVVQTATGELVLVAVEGGDATYFRPGMLRLTRARAKESGSRSEPSGPAPSPASSPQPGRPREP